MAPSQAAEVDTAVLELAKAFADQNVEAIK